MRTFTKLLKIELKLNIRNMNMVIFAVIMPVVVLAVLGIIYQSKPAFPGAEYTFLEQSMSAVCTISICAGGLMGLPIVVSEYRERKILKRFQVTPVSPVMLLLLLWFFSSRQPPASGEWLFAGAGLHLSGAGFLHWFLP